MQPLENLVVACVADDRKLGRIDFGSETLDQFSAAGAAGESDDHPESPGVDGVLEL